MLEFKYTKEGTIYTENSGWSFYIDKPETGLFQLKTANGFEVESLPAVLGEYPETMGLPERRRPHVLSNGAELGLDVPVSIPFGAGPELERRYKFMEWGMSAISDFILRHSFKMNKISAGGLKVSGEIKELLIAKPPENGHNIPAPLLKTSSDFKAGEIVYRSSEPPLSLCFRNADGAELRFNTGEDYWRWINAQRMGGVSEFSITKDAEGAFVFLWDILEWRNQDEEAPHGRNWRLSWSLDWGNDSNEIPASFKDVFDLVAFDWKTDALCVGSDGEIRNAPCASAAGVLNALKRWLRSNLATLEDGDVLAVLNAEAHFCCSATHMNRPKQDSLPHCDAASLKEFRRWGNRQLAPLGAELIILDNKRNLFE